MAVRWYLDSVIGAGTAGDLRRPQFAWRGSCSAASQMDYGNEPWCIVQAEVTPAEHAAIAAQATVAVFPANLDASIGANLASVMVALETRNFPADWVLSSMSYRVVLRWLRRLCALMHGSVMRLGAVGDRLFAGGRTLDSLVSDIPSGMRNNLSTGATALGLDVSGITLAMTIRQALTFLGNQVKLSLTGIDN